MSIACRVPRCCYPVEDMGEGLCWRHAHRQRVMGAADSDEPTPHHVFTPEVVDRLIRSAVRPMRPVPSTPGLVDNEEDTMPNEQTITGYAEPRARINLDRGQRGGYGWSITIRGDDEAEVLERLRALDAQLRIDYLAPEPEVVIEDGGSR